MKHNLFSFFSGSGFLDLGFEALEQNHVQFTNEIHGPFAEAYQYSRKAMGIVHPEYNHSSASVSDLVADPKYLSDLILSEAKRDGILGFIGGPPCPDFSVGGKNRGRKGDNGILSLAYVRLIEQHCPNYFLFENVKGLWKTKKHRAFYEELKHRLNKTGYVLTEKVVNSIEYGVPQDRERIILIGFHRGFLSDIGILISPKDRYIPDGMFPWDTGNVYLQNEVLQLNWPEVDPFEEDSVKSMPHGLVKELTVQYWFEMNNVENHPNAGHHFKPRAGLPKFQSIAEGDVSRKSYKRLHRWRYSPTAAYGNNEVHLHPYRARRISVAEAMSLQSLPKDYALPPNMSLTNMFKTIGNGVPYLVAKALAEAINQFLGGE